MNRRRWIVAGSGAAAAALGVAWRLRSTPSNEGRSPSPEGPAAAGAAASGGPTAFLWQASFPRPEGGTLALSALAGQPLVLNFWATWCPPCIKEMPEIDRFAAAFQSRGGHVVGLAVDSPKAVRSFLAASPVHYAIGLAGFEGTDLSRRLGNDSGALPFTAVFDRQGTVIHKRLGTTSQQELEEWTRVL